MIALGEYRGEKFDVKVENEGARVWVNGEAVEMDHSGKLPVMRETPAMYGARLTKDIGDRPDFYYARREIPRIQADLDEARYDVWQTAKIIRECQKHNRWPRNTSVCIGFGRCPYFDLCTNGFDIAAGVVPEGFVQLTNVHPELTEGDSHDRSTTPSAADGPPAVRTSAAG